MRKDATVFAVPAQAVAGPRTGPDQHHCPFCDKTLGWEEFQAHASACIAAHPDKVREIQER